MAAGEAEHAGLERGPIRRRVQTRFAHRPHSWVVGGVRCHLWPDPGRIAYRAGDGTAIALPERTYREQANNKCDAQRPHAEPCPDFARYSISASNKGSTRIPRCAIMLL